jgi:hypothetical protein
MNDIEKKEFLKAAETVRDATNEVLTHLEL